MTIRQAYILTLLLLVAVQLSAQTFTNYTTAEGLVNNTVNCLTVDEDDNLWFGTDAGISFLNQEDETWVTLNVAQGTGLADDRITAIYMSPFSGLWVGTDFGISNWDGTMFTSYTEADGIGDNRIQWITENEDGVLYFANKDGFSSFDGEEWQVFGREEGLPFGGVRSISVLEDDIVALGLGLEGAAIFDVIDTTFFTIDTTDNLLSNKVKSVFWDNDNDELWVASDNGMDRIYGDENDDPVVDSHPSVFELPPPHEVNQLTDVKIDSEGTIWAGVWIEYLTNIGGISYYDGEIWTTLDVDDGLVGPVVLQLAIDSRDCVWAATSTGVSKYCTPPSSLVESSSSEFKFYPNPASSTITIDFEKLTLEPLDVFVLNPQMQIQHSERLDKGTQSHNIDLANLTAGIYFLRIGDDLQKFIKI